MFGISPAGAQLPAGFTDTAVAAVGSPTALAFTPDGRLLICTQPGQLRIYQGGTLLAAPALDISGRICSNSERGLLGVTTDPNFAVNNFIYVYYSAKRVVAGSCASSNVANRVSRFTLPPANVINEATEVILVDNIQSPAGNHNGGDLHFGGDGYLYVSVGDGGCDIVTGLCSGQNANSRRRDILLGKILRIASDGSIPVANPYAGLPGARRCGDPAGVPPGTEFCSETYNWGLRNPFRFAFDGNAGASRFFINDVGQNLWEEIDLGSIGADYGWNVREGPCVNGSSSNCGPPPAGMTNPIFSYFHGTGCGSITGGDFVPNGNWPIAYDSTYMYSDYVCGSIFQLAEVGGVWTSAAFETGLGGSSAVSLIFGPYGAGQSLYYTSYAGGGEVRRVDYTGSANRSPTAVASASPTSGALPLDVTFDATGSSDLDGDPMTFDWVFGDGFVSNGNTSLTVLHTYTTTGIYTATLTVHDDQGGTSLPESLQINAGNFAPVPQIIVPAAGATFVVGQGYTLQGSASDPEDGTLPSSSLSWEILLHHIPEDLPGNAHTHPFLPPTIGNDIPIVAPAPEDLLATLLSYLEIRLTATDSQGLPATVTRNFDPSRVPISFETVPTGLNVVVNGGSYAAPRSFTSWENWGLTVSAPDQVDGGGQSWLFASWSDGGALSHTIVTPAVATTYTATFVAACVTDTEAPVVTAPAPLAIPQSACAAGLPGASGNTSAALAAFLVGASGTDNCDPTPTALPPQVGGVDADNATFFAIGTTTVTFRMEDASSNIGTATSDVTVTLFYADLDQSGMIDAGDSVILSNFLVGNLSQGAPPFTAPLAAADVNVDTGVNAVDAVLLANYLVGNLCLPSP